VGACLQLRYLTTDFLYLRAFARRGPHRKHSFPSIVDSIHVYIALAWQLVDQISYNIYVYVNNSDKIKLNIHLNCNWYNRQILFMNLAKILHTYAESRSCATDLSYHLMYFSQSLITAMTERERELK
jgi:hypothetical protein